MVTSTVLNKLKALKVAGIFIICLLALPCHADDVFAGVTVSGGPVMGEKSGSYADVTAYGGLAYWLFAGAETKKVNHATLNAVYLGAGITSLLQTHIGASNYGAIYRIKSEIAPFAWLRGGVYSDSRDPLASLKRLTVSLTYENTFKNRGMSNFTVGIGYAFN